MIMAHRVFMAYGAVGMMWEKTVERKDILWTIRENTKAGRAGKHEVYWGCHGCDMEKGHEGKCKCFCGKIPSKTAIFYGKDFEGFSDIEFNRRVKAKGVEDQIINQGLKYATDAQRRAAIKASKYNYERNKEKKARAEARQKTIEGR